MRYCLSCQSTSSSGPICSQCGRSFGGRLCPEGHLSGYDAQFCGECRSQTLLEGAAFIPLGGILRLLFVVGAAFGAWWLVPRTGLSHVLAGWGQGAGRQLSSAYGWVVLQEAVIAFLLIFCWGFGGMFMPPLQKAVERLVGRTIILFFKVIGKMIEAVFRLLLRLLDAPLKK